MKQVADTSWVYALLNGEDPHHAKAKREGPQQVHIMVPPAVLAETVGLIQHRSGGDRQRARAAVAALEATGNVLMGSPEHDHDAAMRVWDAHEGLSYVDAAAIAAARRASVGLLTFDKEQLRAHRSGRP